MTGIIRKCRILVAGATSAVVLGALSVAATAGAAAAPPQTTLLTASTVPSVPEGPLLETKDAHEWAGYVATGGGKPFTWVEAEFKVAAVDCGVTPHPSWTSQWVGLDGWHGTTVEQIGVRSQCGGVAGSPPNAAHYFAWWEMYPDRVHDIGPVSAGDRIVAEVDEFSAGEYGLDLQDLTKGGGETGYAEPCPSVCKNASAEVISEGYNGPAGKGPADFGRESFSDISLGQYGDLIGNFATESWTDIAVVQDQENGHGDLVVDADPTPLSDKGAAFSVAWHSDK